MWRHAKMRRELLQAADQVGAALDKSWHQPLHNTGFAKRVPIGGRMNQP
jgi:hypothetical protein